MRLRPSLSLVMACVMTLHGEETDESWEIHGRVVDASGGPVEEFEAATFWSSNGKYWDDSGEQFKIEASADIGKIWKEEGVLAVNPRSLAKPLPGGRLDLKVEGEKRVVFVMDKEHRRGGCVVVRNEDKERTCTVTLRPLVRMSGRIHCPEAGRTPDWTGVKVHAVGDHQNQMGFILCGSLKGEFSFLLPPGHYDLDVGSQSPDASMPAPRDRPDDMPASCGMRIEIPEQQEPLDLGVLFVEFGDGKNGVPRGDYSKCYGQEPPALETTDACGVDKNVKLSNYRGRWVLVDFWTLGCGPCVQHSLPKLAKFYEEHAADRDKFEILAICVTDSDGATTKEQYQQLVAPIVEKVWHGKPLPYPVLIDGKGRTLNAYGIQGVPTTLLIDPAGHLVKFGDEALLAERLREQKP